MLVFAFAFVAACFSKVAEMGPNTMPKNLKNARQLTNNSKTRRQNRPQNALNGHQDCSGRRLCGRPAFGTLKIDTVLQNFSRFCSHLADLWCHLDPSWVPKRVPKPHFWQQVSQKVAKMMPKNENENYMQISSTIDAKMGGLDGSNQSSRSILVSK